MGVLFDMAAFHRWLEQATDRELVARRDAARSLESTLTDQAVKQDLRYLVRQIEQELLARKMQP